MAGERSVKIKFSGDPKGLVAAEAVAESSLDRFQKKVKKAADNVSILRVTTAALGPAILPILAVATGAAIGLGAAFLSAGAALGVFGAVSKSAFKEVQTASQKTANLQDRVRLLDEQIKVANKTGLGDAGKFEAARDKTLNELIARYHLMPPALRKVTMAYDSMKSSWAGFVEKNKPAVYSVMTRGFSLITALIPKLQPLFDVASDAVSGFVGWIGKATSIDKLSLFTAWLAVNAEPALANLGVIANNVGTFLANMFAGFAPQGQGFLTWLATATTSLAKWSAGNGLKDFVAYVSENGPKVGASLAAIAAAAVNITKAVTPLAPVSLAIATALAAIIAAMPPGVITALVAAWIAYTVALGGYNLVVGIVSAATTVWTGIQWLLNVALTANPIGLIIVAIGALIAVIVLIATKTTWFQTAWKASWGAIKAAGLAVGEWFVNTLWKKWIVGAWNGIVKAGTSAFDWFKSLPGKLKSALSTVKDIFMAPFRAGFNAIASIWNNTVGRLSFTVPSWVPGIGGKGFSMPNLPQRAMGGPVMANRSYLVGENGPEVLTMGGGSGNITPNHELGGGPDVLELHLDLGEGIHKVVEINLKKHDRGLKRRMAAA